MVRILLTILLPVALPLALYLLYVKMARPQPAPGQAGDPAATARSNAVVLWIALGAATLAIVGMVALWANRGVPPGTKLIAPRLENGEIVPSRRLEQTP